jgi:hypothetical protein
MSPRNRLRKHMGGQALVELTLILPMLLTLTLGAVELSNIVYTYQVMHHLAAQGASMTARLNPPPGVDPATYLANVISQVINASCPIISQGRPPATCPDANLPKWRVIYTEIAPDTANSPPFGVVNQIVRGEAGVDDSKRICRDCGLTDFATKCSPPGCIPPNNVPNLASLASDEHLYAVEVFYNYSPITVLGNFVGDTFSGSLYERSIY